ncbi:hypothetical protein IV203_019899 [Nitzschia inconspicua]|uniref:MBD domain-containing protein n=1 Tax=Nitzschia inconspicua TaxID=303405 RepID=A0A9K3LZL8_9STRA|nr:hypothetical protein IV203_019899 [Nitzschia inconspicua]
MKGQVEVAMETETDDHEQVPKDTDPDTTTATNSVIEKEKKPAKEPLEELDQSLIGVNVAKDFDGVPYIGQILGARKSGEGPLYKVLYRDGDEEEYSTEEVLEGKEKYNLLQAEMWDCMTTMIEGLNVDALKDAGITTISDLELFGGGAASTKDPASSTPFDSLDMPLKTKQQLFITATYLLNDQILTKDSKFSDMARYNHAKATGTLSKPRSLRSSTRTVPKKAKVVKAAATIKKARGRPPKNAVKEVVTEKKPPKPAGRNTMASKAGAAKSTNPAPKISSAPKTKAKLGTTAKVTYSGPPTDPLEGVPDWPGSASEGWKFTTKERSGGSSIVDQYWTTPGGIILRSKKEVRKFLVALEQNDGDEKEAKKSYQSVKL